MKRLVSRRPTSQSKFIEPLEGRQLLSVTTRISSVTADNRGEVIMSVTAPLNAATVTKSGVQAYTAGPDGKLGTTDDVHLPASVRYSSSLNRITVNAQVSADVAYRVRIVSSRVKDANGQQIDGEFNGGSSASGNGRAGGIFEFAATRDTSGTPTARLYTSAGTISLTLYRALKPISVANFLNYANSGDYDGIFVTRAYPNSSPFVEQLGGLKVNGSNQVVEVPDGSPIPSEFNTNGVITNGAYTVAFALSGSSNNTATNEFFFNQQNNGSNLDNQNGGFTVFATANNKSSIATIKAIAAKQEVDLSSLNNTELLNQVPVNSTYDGTLNPSQDLVVIRRVVTMNKVGAVA